MAVSDIDYGPLAALVGTWKGDRGMDVSPEQDGVEENPYYETIVFEAAGDVTNDEVFHDQIGYWTWDPRTRTIARSVNIPRVVAVLAGGRFDGDPTASRIALDMRAAKGDADWGIIESPFMRDSASTVAFEHHIEVDGASMKYAETSTLQIYGRRFEHTDANELTRL